MKPPKDICKDCNGAGSMVLPPAYPRFLTVRITCTTCDGKRVPVNPVDDQSPKGTP